MGSPAGGNEFGGTQSRGNARVSRGGGASEEGAALRDRRAGDATLTVRASLSTINNYRPEIDGLRAIAVSAVIANHFDSRHFRVCHYGVADGGQERGLPGVSAEVLCAPY